MRQRKREREGEGGRGGGRGRARGRERRESERERDRERERERRGQGGREAPGKGAERDAAEQSLQPARAPRRQLHRRKDQAGREEQCEQ